MSFNQADEQIQEADEQIQEADEQIMNFDQEADDREVTSSQNSM